MIRSRTRRSAFPLFEVLLVLGLIAMLAGVAVVGYTRVQGSANKNAAKALVASTAHAVKLYHMQMNSVPTTEEGLAALFTVPQDEKQAQLWRDGGGPFLEESRVPVDPWQQELKYEKVDAGLGDTAGPEFRVWSVGPDKADQTEDDIKSWNEAAN
jgi:general secretion pathway protein G